MTNEEKLKKVEEKFMENDVLKLMSINDVNFRPHPYMIGSKHIAYASDHFGGRLDERTLEKVPCAEPGCILSYAEHTSDKVLFLQLKRNATDKEIHKFVDPLVETLKELKVDGIAFVETEEKFRINE